MRFIYFLIYVINQNFLKNKTLLDFIKVKGIALLIGALKKCFHLVFLHYNKSYSLTQSGLFGRNQNKILYNIK